MPYQLLPLPFLIWALFSDIRTRKISNRTTYPLMLLGLAIQGLLNGPALMAGFFMGIFLYVLLSGHIGTMHAGGGDIKLMMGCLMFMDIRIAEIFIVMVFIVSALLAMVQYARRSGVGRLVQLLKVDILTAGAAPQESVHVMGALVILIAYGIAVSYGLNTV